MSAKSSLLSSLNQILSPKPRPIDRLLGPFQTFTQHKLAGAGLLMLATAVALIWANSPWEHSYHHLLHTEVGVRFGTLGLSKSLHHWINDGLMGVFFFMVGLEIKRELMAGELSTLRKATLPAVAAIGGMVVPALIYFALNLSGAASRGWGVPMATDIAFALGVLALLGDRVPVGLKVFLTALAIVDDIGAVVVIALFYTAELSFVGLTAGLICLAISIGLNLLGARNAVVYFIVGTLAWLGFLESGVHATIAAILMAFTIPARTRIDGAGFLERIRFLLAKLESAGLPEDKTLNSHTQQRLFEKMDQTIEHASAPLQRIEHAIAAPVAFVVLPVFALANAGVTVHGGIGAALSSPVVLGIVGGLFLGKTLGIFVASWLAVRLGIADLPEGVSYKQLFGVGMLAGIGFTMALFVSMLAFSDADLQERAKIGVLTASLISGLVGFLVVRTFTRRSERA
ncbi:MAG: Na+/H+ antiporter NhaA [Deltaproteobacteria bacterium]|jgi:NhaA family Na+:H+ antiporter|nr:Na+/H+ antiporter NhaA [Deltaproteobacteria bacterium]MBW2533013.1 Na+/H+ antiporter NhaA [Deltaproteobacteria bacterium]